MIINEDYIWLVTASILGLTDADKNNYSAYCNIAARELEQKLNEDVPEDLPAVAGAFLAIYYYCLVNSISDLGDVEFEAGDIRVKCDSSMLGISALKDAGYSLIKKYISPSQEFCFRVV